MLQEELGLSIRLLIISDINLFHALRMRSRLLERKERYDFIILCGPLVEYNKSAKNELGTIISMISHFQTVCNKICYLLTEEDPFDNAGDIIMENLFFIKNNISFGITPNSRNISNEKIILTENLFIAGYSEITDINRDIITNDDNIYNAMDILSNDQINTDSISTSSLTLIKKNEKSEIEQLLMKTIEKTSYDLEIKEILNDDDGDDDDRNNNNDNDKDTSINGGIFFFDYKYSESLDNFIMHEEFKNFNIKLMIVTAKTNDVVELAQKCPHNDCPILITESFNKTGNYYSVSMESVDDIWKVTDIMAHNFN